MTGSLTFRAMTEADLAVLAPWLEAPRTKRWFTDSDFIEDMEDHLEDPRIAQWIVERAGVPIAYLQDYEIHGFEDHPLAFLPVGARGLDTFMAEPAMGQGLGPRYLSARIEALFANGVPAVGIDPHPQNAAAIRAYEKVGFVARGQAQTEWGPALLMVRAPGR